MELFIKLQLHHVKAAGREPIYQSPFRASLLDPENLSRGLGVAEVTFDDTRPWGPGEDRNTVVKVYSDEAGAERLMEVLRSEGPFPLFSPKNNPRLKIVCAYS